MASLGPESNNFFITYGNKMNSKDNVLSYRGNNKWNSGYSDGFSTDGNEIVIEVEISKLSIAYGCVIGIVSNPKYKNDYFHFNKFDIVSYALKSDSSQFCEGKKVSKKGNKFKTKDIVTITVSDGIINWFVNSQLQCTQKEIAKDVNQWYLGIAMLGKNDCVKILKFIKREKTT